MRSAEHHHFWTLNYPSASILTVLDIIWVASHVKFQDIACPLLVIGCHADGTINWNRTLELALTALPRSSEKFIMSLDSDGTEHKHVLMSNILSPSSLERISSTAISFAKHVCR